MTPERWRQIKELFHDALDQPPAERDAFLARGTAGDSALRAEVVKLLAADEVTESPLERPVADLTARLLTHNAESDLDRRIGPHRLVREIGRGGMGTVYLAVREDGQYRDQVAIKLIKRGMDSDAIIGRFVRERQILADLDHPNIARLLDGGLTDDGLPYFVMEYIEGQPIDAYCDAHRLTTSRRLELFRTVCSAVHAAHRRLIVHCDLKPSNILVTAEGVTKLVDFGVARLLDPERDPLSPAWTAASRLLTPGYASPEQIRGQALTTASDVYSLGVVLYELLTGHRPYRFETGGRREMERVVCEQQPERPSTAIRRPPVDAARDPTGTATTRAATPEAVSRRRATVPDKLGRRLTGDLDNIVLMALRKEPERRYGSAEQLAEDLRRHLDGLPVLARQPTLGYRVGKFLRRHWLGVAAALLVVASLVVGIVAIAWQAREAKRQQRTAEQALEFLTELFDSSGPNEAVNLSLRDVLDEGAARISRELEDEPLAQANLMFTLGGVFRSLGEYSRAEPLLERALAIRRRELGEVHSDVADGLRGLAILCYQQDRLDEAEKLVREALAIQRALPGETDDKIADHVNNLALVLEARGVYDKAEAYFREALELRRGALGETHEDVATSLNNLAVLLRRRGNYEEAEQRFREALAMRRQLLGPQHLRIASTLSNLAVLLRKREGVEEAEELLNEALAMQRQLLGEEHPDIAATLNNLASLRSAQGDSEQAAELYRQALAMQRKLLGQDHSDTTWTIGNLGALLFQQRDYSAAEPLLREGLELDRKRLGDDHPTVAIKMINLASLLRARGDDDAAESLYREALDIRRRVLGEEHPEVAQGAMGLGAVLTDRGALQEAEELLRNSLTILVDADWQPLTIAIARRLLGVCLTAQRRFGEAETLLLESHTQHLDLLGGEHPRTLVVRRHLVELYDAWGKPAAAEAFR